MTDPDFLHALWLTILIALIAVPLNTIFGIACALVLVRQRFRGKAVLNALVDLPFALSPVVVGLALFLVYARTGWFGPWLGAHGIQIVFALPAMVLATIFVSLPFVVREVVPVLREIGTEQEEAAWTLGASPLADLPQDHASRDPLGRDLRRRAHDRTLPGRVRRRVGRLGEPDRQDPDAYAAREQPLPGL